VRNEVDLSFPRPLKLEQGQNEDEKYMPHLRIPNCAHPQAQLSLG
jgi:hypothetical protein